MPMSARTRLSNPIYNYVFFAIAAIGGGVVLYRAVANPLAKMELLASWAIVCLISIRTARRLRLETERYRVAKAESVRAARISQLTSALSHARTQAAVDALWMYTGEMFTVDATERVLIDAGIAADTQALHARWTAAVHGVFAEATLAVPADAWMQGRGGRGGKHGVHSEHLSRMLAEMQVLPRSCPDARW